MAVLYIYCDYKDNINQTDRNLFASLAKQSVLQHASLPSEARALYSQCKDGGASASSEQCLSLLRSCIKGFRRNFIVIDALDEHLLSDPEEDALQIPLLVKLKAIQSRFPALLSLFVTSRAHLSIQTQMPHHTKIVVEAHEEDIRRLVDTRIQDPEKFKFAKDIATCPEIGNDIVKKLVKNAQGM
jgi:hypothetical protein